MQLCEIIVQIYLIFLTMMTLKLNMIHLWIFNKSMK